MTLLQKVLVAIVSIALVTVGGVGVFVFGKTKAALQDTIGENQLEVTRQTLNKIDRLLYERYLDILAISEDNDLQLFIPQYIQTQKTEVAIDVPENLKSEFNKNLIVTGPWNILFIADTNGIIRLATDEKMVGQQVQGATDYRVALERALQGEVYSSDLVFSGYTSKPTIIFAAPIKSTEAGRHVLGVVFGDFAWPVILEIMEELSAKAHLYNSQGLLIASSDPDESADDLLRDDSDKSIVQGALEEREKFGVFPFSLQGDYSVLASHGTQLGYLNYRGNNWKLVLETPTAVAFAPARKEALQLVGMVVFISAMGAFLLFVIIHRGFLRPVSSLTKTAEVIAKGDLAQRANVSSRDEIGRLAVSFNTMTDSLLEARVFPKRLIQKMKDGIIALDGEGRVELMNPQAEKFLGIKQADAKGKRIEELRDNPSLTLLDKLFRQSAGTFVPKELFLGNDMVTEVTIVPLKFIRRSKEFMIVIHDITREKRIEHLKTEFVSIAAHQLRTPLSAVKWAMRLLLDGDAGRVSKEQRDLLGKAYMGNERMILLVNDLLDVARIEEGRFMQKPMLTDMEEVIRSAVENLEEIRKEKGVAIEVQLSKQKIPMMFVDPAGIKLVMQNLLENAIRYTNQKGKVIISPVVRAKTLVVSIQDNGIGIASDERERVFSKFFRGRRAIVMETDGSGLGLFITKNIVEAHGGKIWFDSKENKGTTFSFMIPFS